MLRMWSDRLYVAQQVSFNKYKSSFKYTYVKVRSYHVNCMHLNIEYTENKQITTQ